MAPVISLDRELPESFTPFVEQSPVLFDGKAVLVFVTQDKLSGIDHYEVAEAKPAFLGDGDLVWENAVSPYVLKDQRRRAILR